jgi:hypothetical protein
MRTNHQLGLPSLIQERSTLVTVRDAIAAKSFSVNSCARGASSVDSCSGVLPRASSSLSRLTRMNSGLT